MKAILLLCVTTLHAVVGSSGHEWWRTMSLYQVYPRSYKDSNGDGLGDIKGIISKLDHMTESHIDAFWVSPFYSSPMVDFGYDISDYRSIFPAFGTMKDFEDMVKAAHSKNLKVVIDFVPNHTSDQHEWFQKSLKNIKPYSDYYVWHEGRKLENGTRAPPNNWISIFGGSAWTWRPERNAYYYHQYTKEQPDVNYFNEDLVQEMKDILKFWLDKGIDGIRVDAAARLCENQTFADEPLSGLTNDPNNFAYTVKIYTRDHPRNYEIVRGWSKVLAQYEGDKVMMIEAYTDLNHTMEFYDAGASYPFNFAMVINLNSNSTAKDWKFIVDRWIDNMPKGATPNWVAGNHDNSRLVTRLGPDRARAITAMTFILPGVTVTYNGDEIGMEDTWVSYKNTQDPHGCNEGPEGYEKTSRDPVRSPFQWDATTSAGFSTNAKTWIPVNDDYKTVNLASEKKDKDSFYNFYNSLAILKKVNPAVRKGNLTDKLLTDNVLYIARNISESMFEQRITYVHIRGGKLQSMLRCKPSKEMIHEVIRSNFFLSDYVLRDFVNELLTKKMDVFETVSQGAVYAILNVANSTEVVDLSEIQKPKCKLRVYYASAGFGLKKGALLCNESVKVPPYGTLVLTRH